MAGLLPPGASSSEAEKILFEIESDLTRTGTLGAGRLVVSAHKVERYEQTPVGETLLGSWELAKLTKPHVENLVDAAALIADYDGMPVELLRTTSKVSLRLSGGEKRLKALIAGEEMPDMGEALRLCPKCGRPLPEDSNVCDGCVNRGKTLLRLFSYANPYKFRLFWGAFLTFSQTLLELLPPILIQLLVDNVLLDKKVEQFPWIIVALVSARLMYTGVNIARARNVAYLGMKMTVAIRTSLFEKLQALSLSYYDRRNVGSIMSRMTNDTGALWDVLVDGLPVVLNQGALLIGIPIALIVMNSQIAFWGLLPIPFVLLAVRLFRKRMVRVWSRFWHSWARLSGALNGILQGTRVVKAFHGEQREVDRFNRRIHDLSAIQYKAETHWANFFPMVQFVMASTAFVVWWVGGHGVLEGRMSLGELTAFLAYLTMLQQPLMMLQRIVDWTTRSLTAAERVFEVMDTPVDIENAKDAVAMPELHGAVKFEDVHFGYEKTREVIHGISLDVKPGEMIGLVGHSGAGKSTLINLLMRFYDPTQGHIEIDGVDLRKVRLDDFRSQVGVVLQESYLFPGTVRHNILYGRPEASLEEVIEAAKAANAHDFISKFPDGYDSYVGERGQRLSGGERQRIAIARAILHNPRILVLDEATASVDTETERLIQEALEHLVSGRTTFAIAHRLSTLRNADRLVVISDGIIAEVGTHDELLANPEGIYSGLVKMQQQMNKITENYLPEEI